MYNKIVTQFFNSHGINPEYISSKVDTTVYKTPYFLGDLSSVVIYKPQVESEVSIGDIYVCDKHININSTNIFELLNSFYKEEQRERRSFYLKSDQYNSRSNDNLSLDTEAMIEKCNNTSEAMTICRIDNANNINLVYTNGMHRYLALRTLYLKMLSEHPDKTESIKDKFRIRVALNEIDEIKTFCYFIFKHYQSKSGIKVGYKQEYVNHEYTGRLQMATLDGNKLLEEFAFTDNELIEFVKPFIDMDLDYYKSIEVPSFRNFLISLGYNIDVELVI